MNSCSRSPGSRTLIPSLAIGAAILILLLPMWAAAAEWQFARLKSFGDPDRDAFYPIAGVIVGTDGVLYGTTWMEHGALYRVGQDGRGFRVLHRFGNDPDDGSYPVSRPLEGSDGFLYGTTSHGGGEDRAGTVFKINRDGTGYEVLHRFDGYGGSSPEASLIEASDGFLYGTASHGSLQLGGVLFRLAKDGSGYQVLHEFEPGGESGAYPRAALLEGSDGMLYGTSSGRTHGGSFSDSGKVFRLNKDGTEFEVLHHFGYNDGFMPSAPLIEGRDGALYGTTFGGGSSGLGTVFKLRKDGSDFRVLHSFDWRNRTQGVQPAGPLVHAPNGLLYGLTTFGGRNRTDGTIYALDPGGSFYVTLHTFGNHSRDARYPVDGLAVTRAGTLFGVALGGNASLGAIFKANLAGRVTIIAHFNRGGDDGTVPSSAPVAGPDGMIYGTTETGGSANVGTIFKIAPDGTGYKKLWNFMGGRHGANPQGISIDPDKRTVFGITSAGGTHDRGTLFRLSPDGRYTVLRSFRGYPDDGDSPRSAPTLASDGALYGTTWSGGSSGRGTIYRIKKDGSGYQLLYQFGESGEGFPGTQLLESSDGGLYGTCEADDGALFRLNKDGSGFTAIHHFDSSNTNGYKPGLALIEASDGRLYGTTERGNPDSSGTVFRLHRDGSDFEILHTFPPLNGSHSSARLLEGIDGALYGMTASDGAEHHGSIFRLDTTGGDFTTIHEFMSVNQVNGRSPFAGLFQTADGALYGVTREGGDLNYGTLFKLNPVQ